MGRTSRRAWQPAWLRSILPGQSTSSSRTAFFSASTSTASGLGSARTARRASSSVWNSWSNSTNLAVALFGAEEIGCQGAYHAPAAWFRNVGYVIEFDSPGYGQISQARGGTQLFAGDGEFIRCAGPVLAAHGLTRWQRHASTNATALRRRFSLSCLNLPCGCYNARGPDEYLVLGEVETALAAGADLVRALGCRRYPFGAADDEVGAGCWT